MFVLFFFFVASLSSYNALMAKDFDTLTGVAPQLRYFFGDIADTEIAAIANVTAGTQAAGKVVVADANVNIGIVKATELHIGTSGSETQVTATGTELNYTDTTPGTQAASKAVIADANINTGISKVTELHVGTSGAETKVDVVYNPGRMSVAYVNFNTVGASAMNVTIDTHVYTEGDTVNYALGRWTNGDFNIDSSDSLIAAINGDTRTTVPFTAVAGISDDGLWVFWDAVGTAGNVTLSSSDASATVQNSTEGEAAAINQVANIVHTVNTQELLSGGVEIPIPFTPTKVLIDAYDSAGTPIAFTDKVTIQSSPDRIRIDTDGGTNLANTNVIHLVVSE
jgi:hypothetical protein